MFEVQALPAQCRVRCHGNDVTRPEEGLNQVPYGMGHDRHVLLVDAAIPVLTSRGVVENLRPRQSSHSVGVNVFEDQCGWQILQDGLCIVRNLEASIYSMRDLQRIKIKKGVSCLGRLPCHHQQEDVAVLVGSTTS